MICLDTPLLIWGVRGISTRGQEHEIVKAARYIRWLKMKNLQVMVPTPVLAEFLVGATATELHEMSIFEMGFQIPPFDIPAAKITADLMRDAHHVKAIREEYGIGNQCIKTDAMILAIAISRNAQQIITSDNHFKSLEKLSGGKIAVSGIPEIPANVEDQQQDFL
jgi:predicted nucleic acid-binding protein